MVGFFAADKAEQVRTAVDNVWLFEALGVVVAERPDAGAAAAPAVVVFVG